MEGGRDGEKGRRREKPPALHLSVSLFLRLRSWAGARKLADPIPHQQPPETSNTVDCLI
jgi:hypothetical protein